MKASLIVLFICLAFASSSEEIIDAVNKAQTTWKAGPVSNVDKYHSLLGALIGGPSLPIKTYKNANVDIPDSFDSREIWPKCPSLREIRDQANCGDCWAVAAAEAASDRLCIATNGTFTKNLSEQDLVSCCMFCVNSCSGGYTPHAWTFMAAEGISTGSPYGSQEGCLPYFLPKCNHFQSESQYKNCEKTVDAPHCEPTCQDGYPLSYSEDKHFFKDGYQLSTTEDMQIDIMKHGPVEVTIIVFEDFVYYKGGVYKHVTGDRWGAHAVKVVGWGIENDVKYWIIANSWNEEWGENGFIRVDMTDEELEIDLQIVAGVPAL